MHSGVMLARIMAACMQGSSLELSSNMQETAVIQLQRIRCSCSCMYMLYLPGSSRRAAECLCAHASSAMHLYFLPS